MVEPAGAQKPQPERHLWEFVWVRDLVGVGLIVLVLWVAYQVRGVLLPLFLAWAVAYLLEPVLNWAQTHWRLPRTLTAALVLVALAGLAGGFIAWVGPLLVQQTVGFVTEVPRHLQRIANQYGIEVSTVAEHAQRLSNRLQEDPMALLRSVFTGSGELFGFVGMVIGSTLYLIVALTVWLVFYFYFAACFPRLTRWFQGLLPLRTRPRVMRLLRRMDQAVGGFFRSRVLAKMVVGLLFAVGWWLAGVPYWFLLGILAGLLNILPFASIVCLPLAVMLKYFDLTSAADAAPVSMFSVALWPVVVFFAVQSLDEWVVAPLFGARASNLNVVTVLLVALVGASLGGLWGVLLAVPLAACLKVLMQSVFLPRWRYWVARH